MTISVNGEPTEDYLRETVPRLDLAMDKAKAFLLALRDGDASIVVDDGSFRVEFVIADNGPTFAVSKAGQERSLWRFNAGWDFDVKAMAENLLAEIGP